MEALFAFIPAAITGIVNWVKQAGTSKPAAAPAQSGTVGGTINNLLSSFSTQFTPLAESKIASALQRMFTLPGAETPFERDVEYQGAVSGEISDMKRLADMALSSLPSGAGSTAAWIQSKFQEQAGILASGQRNVADPGMFKGAMERLLIYFRGSASDGAAVTDPATKTTVESWLKGQGVPLDVTAGGTTGSMGTLYDVLNSLLGSTAAPFSTVPTSGGSDKILYTAPVTQAAPDYTPMILLGLGGLALVLIFKKRGK